MTKVKRSDKRTLAALAKKFEDGLRDDELSREFKDVHVFLLLGICDRCGADVHVW